MTDPERKRVVATTHHLKRAALNNQRNLGRGGVRRPDWVWVAIKAVVAAILAVVVVKMLLSLRTPLPSRAELEAAVLRSPQGSTPQVPVEDAEARMPGAEATSGLSDRQAPVQPARNEAVASASQTDPTYPDYSAMFKAIMDRHLARLRPPTPGKSYTVTLNTGRTVVGKLVSVDSDAAVLDVEHGRIKLRRKDIQRMCWPDLFPRRAARIIARHEVTRAMASAARSDMGATREVAGKAAQHQALGGAASKPGESLPWTSVAGEFPFSPEVLQAWLKVQGQSTGIPIARQMQAQKDRENLVLWLTVTPQFLMLEPEQQASLTASIEGFWASQCRATGQSRNTQDAVVILLDSARTVVGGNTAKALQMNARASNVAGLMAPAPAALLDDEPNA